MENPSRVRFVDERGQFAAVIHTQKNLGLVGALLFYGVYKLFHNQHRIQRFVEREGGWESFGTWHWVAFGLMFVLSAIAALATLVWVAWTMWGAEVVTIERERLVIRYRIGPWHLQRAYPLRTMEGLQVKFERNPVGSILKGGNIAFLSEGKEQRFGWTLNKEDAETVIAELRPHLQERVIHLIRSA